MLKAILFDLDGTLANTDPLHYQTWEEILQNYGMEMDRDFYKARISGRLNSAIVEDLLPALSKEAGQQLADGKESRFREIALNLKPLAGLLDILAWIEERKLKTAVVTNAPRENARFMLNVLRLSDRFDTVVLAEEAIAGKPNPAPYELALTGLGVLAEEAIAFEDSGSGIKAAVAAGIYTIGVASTHDPEVLFQAGATMVISDFTKSELWQFLDRQLLTITD